MNSPFAARNERVKNLFELNKEILGLKDMETDPRRILFTKKEVDKLDVIKQLFRYYEYLGQQQVNEKWARITRLYETAYGKINKTEFNNAKDNYNIIINKLTGELEPNLNNLSTNKNGQPNPQEIDEVDLNFFPLIPPIINSILNDSDKKITRMYVKAVNPEATNSVIEDRNKELQSILVEQATRLFEVGLEGLDEETKKAKMDLFQKSKEIKEFYEKDHRLDVELWANHVLNIEDQKYNIKDLEKQLLEKILISDLPFIKVEYNGSDYKYSPVDERNCFYLRSPLDDDASQYMMFGTFNYSTIDAILGKYKIDEETAKTLEEWSTVLNGQIYLAGRGIDPNENHLEITTEALRYHKQLHANASNTTNSSNIISGVGGYNGSDGYSYGNNQFSGNGILEGLSETSEIPPNLIRETVIHAKIPRKVGELTYLVNGVKYTQKVDESYKVYVKPEYDLTWTTKKTAENLVNGEHVDWFYETQSWTCVKLDVAAKQAGNIYSDFTSIWLKVERDEIQVTDPFRRFTTILPVHGGRSSQMTDTLSLVEKGDPWQSMFNFIGNRCKSLLASEIGLFYVLNQGLIPHESFDGSWDKNNLLKWGQLAHDLGVTPISSDINQVSGSTQLMMGQGYGQVVDLTKTRDIMDKLALMQNIKREFYNTLGIAPEQMAEISPYQSGKSVAQGLQRTSNMLHHYYKRTKDIMKRARQTGLCYAKYLQETNPKDLVYTSNEGLKITARFTGKDFTLADLAIYLHNDLDDIDKLNDLYSLVMNDNTMGADSFEKANMLFSKTSTEVLSKLKDLKLERDSKIEEERNFQAQQQQAQIEAQKEQLVRELEHKDRQADLDRQNNIEVAQLKSIGYANDDSKAIKEALDSTIKEQNSLREHDLKLREILRKENADKEKVQAQKDSVDRATISKESIELMKLQQRDKEVKAQNERTKAMLALKNKSKQK